MVYQYIWIDKDGEMVVWKGTYIENLDIFVKNKIILTEEQIDKIYAISESYNIFKLDLFNGTDLTNEEKYNKIYNHIVNLISSGILANFEKHLENIL